MGLIGAGAGALAALFGGTPIANALSADDAPASHRMYLGGAASVALGIGVSKFLKMKSVGDGLVAGGVMMAGMGWKASQFEEANPTNGANLVNGAAAVLGLPSPVVLNAQNQLPAPSGGATNPPAGTQSTQSPLVINRTY